MDVTQDLRRGRTADCATLDRLSCETGDLPASVATHFGVVGLLQESALVTGVDQDGAACRCRKASGGDMVLRTPRPHMLAADDLVLVRSLTLPDGAVVAVSVKSAAGLEWTAIENVGAIVDRYAAGAGRFVRWSGGLGSAAGAAALLGLAAPVAGVAAIAALTLSAGMHRRARRDRVAVQRLSE